MFIETQERGTRRQDPEMGNAKSFQKYAPISWCGNVCQLHYKNVASLKAWECLLCKELECLPIYWYGNVCCAWSWNVCQFISMGMFAVDAAGMFATLLAWECLQCTELDCLALGMGMVSVHGA